MHLNSMKVDWSVEEWFGFSTRLIFILCQLKLLNSCAYRLKVKFEIPSPLSHIHHQMQFWRRYSNIAPTFESLDRVL